MHAMRYQTLMRAPFWLQVAAFLPATGRFVEEEVEEEARAAGSLQNPKISLTDPKKVILLEA